MKTGPKYKIARRLGAPIFEKTQTAKFSASKERRGKKMSRPKSAFGLQLNEKQKARLTYGVSEKQFKNYVKKILSTKTSGSQTDKLFELLERRLDNVIYRIGFASTRRHARQIVSHGHITVNGKKVTIPSFSVSKDDKITLRKASEQKTIFANIEEKLKEANTPDWISFDIKTKEGKITGVPKANPTELMFDLEAVFEYYRR